MNHDNGSGLRFEYRGAAILIIVHILALFIGFTILANVFQFPEVLRLASSERLALYRHCTRFTLCGAGLRLSCLGDLDAANSCISASNRSQYG